MSGCVLLAACSGPVEIDAPDVGGADREACEAFVDDLPATLTDQEPVETDPEDPPLGAAYGDPTITVVCGVDVPAEFDATSSCDVVDGVGWYAPEEQYDDQGADVTIFSVSHRPVVEMRLPADYRPAGLAAALTQLAGPVKGNLQEVQDCV